METTEFWSFIFFDVLLEKLIIPFHNQIAVTALTIFGFKPLESVLVVAMIANIMASFINIWFGRILHYVGKESKTKEEQMRYYQCHSNRLIRIGYNYSDLMMLFAVVPLFGAMVAVLLGYLQKPFIRLVFMSFVGSFFYYSYHVF